LRLELRLELLDVRQFFSREGVVVLVLLDEFLCASRREEEEEEREASSARDHERARKNSNFRMKRQSQKNGKNILFWRLNILFFHRAPAKAAVWGGGVGRARDTMSRAARLVARA